jgi:tetratricopeptide (TPR) repeat protein
MDRNATTTNSSMNDENKTKMSTSSKDATVSSFTNIRQNICQNFVLLWLDANNDKSNQEFCSSLSQLGRIFDPIKTCTDVDECVKFLHQVEKEKIFMIVSGGLGQNILPTIHEMFQLKSVFVFCGNTSFHEQWTRQYKKVKAVESDIVRICNALHSAARQYDQNSVSISFFSASLESKQTLSQLDHSFMCIQLLNENILGTDSDQKAIKDFAKYCHNQHIESSEIEKFEKEYKINEAMKWYNTESFLFSMLNWALRTLSIDAILKMGFFIHDLHRHIGEVYKEQRDNYKKPFTVYRVQVFSNADFAKLCQNEGGFISFDNFLLVDKNKSEKDYFNDAGDAIKDKDHNMFGIVFVMLIDPKKSTNVFAAISPSEQKFIFSFHTVFLINKAKPMGNDRIYKVKLTLTSDGDDRLDAAIKLMRDETWGLTGWDRLSELLFKLDKFDKAKEVYHALLDRESDDSDKAALLYQQLGRIERQQGDYNSAIKSYEKAREIFKKTSKKADWADSCNNIGLVYENMDDYQKALSFHEEALEIRKEVPTPHHPKLASSYNNIGNVHNKMGHYSEAHSFHKHALEIRKKILPQNHPNLAISYNNLGLVYFNQEEYNKALQNHKKALEIRQNVQPPNNPLLAGSYNNIGLVKEKMGDYAEARLNYGEAIKTAERSLPLNHPHLIMYKANYERVEKL